MPRRRYNWTPDLADQRDFIYRERTPRAAALPAHADLRSLCPPVVDQGQIGSCTGNALAGALGFLELRDIWASHPDDHALYDPEKYEAVSRLFIYYNERALEGSTGSDAGAQLRDGIKSLAQWGACRESVWKYAPTNVLKKPLPKAYAEAKKHKITSYVRLSTLNDCRQCLAEGFPFVLGFSVYESFESAQVAKTGIMPMPRSDESLLGGHAVMAVGYDDDAHALWVRNSWGAKWGRKGYFQMPYEYITERGLAQDFWTIRSE